MAGRWLALLWAPGFLCVALILETASGAGVPSTKAHGHIQFSAGDVNQTAILDCRAVCGLNTSDRCDFVRRNPDCRSEAGYLDYLEGIFCYFTPNLLPLAITLYVSLGPGTW